MEQVGGNLLFYFSLSARISISSIYYSVFCWKFMTENGIEKRIGQFQEEA